ncbi:MAG: radical SAM protein, partial [Candidatus Aenigmatarchaeota archaeon]
MKRLYLATDDIFAIPAESNMFLIYAPLPRIIIIGNSDLAILISLIKKNKFDWLNTDENNRMIKKLLKVGLLSKKRIANTDIDEKEVKFSPKAVTLCVTTDCNLRCVYCFASGGENPKYMKWKIAKAAIDTCLKNLKENETFFLDFHGGGEPTLAWDLINKSIEYSEKICEKRKINLRIGIATNGILSKKQIEYIHKKKITVQLSADGIPKIQNYLRPFKNGKSTYKFVKNTITLFNKLGVSYSVRSTITDFSVKYMFANLKHFHKLGVKRIHFEPSFECGRCFKTKT